MCFASFAMSQEIQAKEFSFYCKSKGWAPSQGFDRAYYQSVSCNKVKSFSVGRAEKKAKAICQKWASYYELGANFETVFYAKDELDECHQVSVAILRDLVKKQINEVARVAKESNPTGTGISFTQLFVDNAGKETPIYLADGREQPQWIQKGDMKVCGLLNQGWAVLETRNKTGDKNRMTLLQLSTGKSFEYLFHRMDGYRDIFIATSDEGPANFLSRSVYQMGQNHVILYNLNPKGDIEEVFSMNMFYVTNSGQKICQP